MKKVKKNPNQKLKHRYNYELTPNMFNFEKKHLAMSKKLENESLLRNYENYGKFETKKKSKFINNLPVGVNEPVFNLIRPIS